MIAATYSISDEDGNLLQIYTSELPSGASFVEFAGEYHFAWTPSISQAGDYEFTIYAEDEAGAVAEHTVTVHVDEKLTYDQLTEAQSFVLEIPDEFFGDKPNRQDNNRRFFLKDLAEIADKFVDGKMDAALSQLLKLMKFCDNGLLGISGNDTDFIVAGDYQEELFDLLADTVKNITYSNSAYMQPTEPLVLVHGFVGSADSWDKFVLNSGLIDGGTVTVTMDDNQNITVDSSNLNPNVADRNFLVYRIELKDGFLTWGDRTLMEQGTMVFVATETIKDYSGSNEFVFLGHSMGGLSIKSFLHYLDRGDSATGYMTIGTPHWGTPLGTWTSYGEFEATREMQLFSPSLMEIGDVTEFDLEFSIAFATKSIIPMNACQDFLPCLDDFLGSCLSQDLMDEFFNSGTMTSDLVVPVWSQRSYWCGAVPMPNETIPGAVSHLGQTKNHNIINRILYEYWLQTR